MAKIRTQNAPTAENRTRNLSMAEIRIWTPPTAEP